MRKKLDPFWIWIIGMGMIVIACYLLSGELP